MAQHGQRPIAEVHADLLGDLDVLGPVLVPRPHLDDRIRSLAGDQPDRACGDLYRRGNGLWGMEIGHLISLTVWWSADPAAVGLV
jgi:hypothetical protein